MVHLNSHKLSICVLFILFMQSENGAQFLNTTSTLLLFTIVGVTAVFGTVIVPLASIYATL